MSKKNKTITLPLEEYSQLIELNEKLLKSYWIEENTFCDIFYWWREMLSKMKVFKDKDEAIEAFQKEKKELKKEMEEICRENSDYRKEIINLKCRWLLARIFNIY